jgi:hypothetical protein
MGFGSVSEFIEHLKAGWALSRPFLYLQYFFSQ